MQSRTFTSLSTESTRTKDLLFYIATNNLDQIKKLNLVSRSNIDVILDHVNKSTALHYALQHPDNSITLYLLSLGADPKLTNTYGKNAFDLSLDYHKSCVFDHVIKQKDNQISDLNNDVANLTKRYKLESDSKAYLQKSVDDYRNTITELKEENGQLKRKIDRLNSSLDTFISSNKK